MKKYIPDFITSMNLVCGLLGVVFAFKGMPGVAFPLMLAAALFDFCDGLAARALGAYSDLGKELDSLCDMVSFGVLPSVMLYNLMKQCTFAETFWCYIPLAIAVFSGIRLAKFNVDERQSHSFIGLPTPACALLVASMCYYTAFEPDSFLTYLVGGNVFVPVLSAVLCILLVCEIPMFSMKFSKSDSKALKAKRICFLINCAICVAITVIIKANWSLAVFFGFCVYILMNIVYAIVGENQSQQ